GKMAARLHVEVATVFDVIKLYERVTGGTASGRETILNRLFIALIKKETAEQAIHFAHEAIEMHGGNGYIEDFVTPRLLRDAQVLTVWEGTANILGLELIRLVNKFEAHRLFIDEMRNRLVVINDSEMKKALSVELNALTTDLTEFAAFDNALQTFEAKSLMKRMAYLYESVVALEWAMKHGGKFEKLAEIYIEDTWSLRNVGDEMKTVAYFDQII
ncbi:MAG TPA: acyl-CoA dehydrogenase family protein, partial [Sporosarcina sp.]|nr:acyl-CoA dehydrogenase family protein [Sporosarcina sp.]